MTLHTTTGALRPTPPFDFAKSLDFLEMFRSKLHAGKSTGERSNLRR